MTAQHSKPKSKLANFLATGATAWFIAFIGLFTFAEVAHADANRTEAQKGEATESLKAGEVTYAKIKKFGLPDRMDAGLNSAGYVFLEEPAGPGGVIIAIASDNKYVEAPRRILIREGDRSGRFPIAVDQLARSSKVRMAISTGEGAIVQSTKLYSAPPVSRTVLQRRVTIRYRVQ